MFENEWCSVEVKISHGIPTRRLASFFRLFRWSLVLIAGNQTGSSGDQKFFMKIIHCERNSFFDMAAGNLYGVQFVVQAALFLYVWRRIVTF